MGQAWDRAEIPNIPGPNNNNNNLEDSLIY